MAFGRLVVPRDFFSNSSKKRWFQPDLDEVMWKIHGFPVWKLICYFSKVGFPHIFWLVYRRVNNNYHHSWFINHALHESNTSNMTGLQMSCLLYGGFHIKGQQAVHHWLRCKMSLAKNQTRKESKSIRSDKKSKNVEKDIWNLIASPHGMKVAVEARRLLQADGMPVPQSTQTSPPRPSRSRRMAEPSSTMEDIEADASKSMNSSRS